MGGHLVIVGTGPAGVRAAEAARAAGHTGPVTVLGAEPHAPYDRPPLPKDVLDPGTEPALPRLREPAALAELGADFRLGVRATGLDPAARTVVTDHGPVAYDALVVASGARAAAVPGFGPATGALSLRGYDDALAVREALGRARELVVLGGGFIGAEIASAARARGIAVTIVEADPVPLSRALGPVAAARLTDLHTAAGVTVLTGTRARAAVPGPGGIAGVRLDGGREIAADTVVVAVGARPDTDWLIGPVGPVIALDPTSGAVVADRSGAASHPGVFAAGDAATIAWAPGGHWTAAVEQGRIAGINAARLLAGTGAEPERFTQVPFAWSTWHGRRIQLIGDNTAGDEQCDGAGLITRVRGGQVVGAVGIDRPADIVKIRRALRQAATPVG